MRYLNIAAVALNQTPLDWGHNEFNILAAIEEARQQDVTLLGCPELCITGYGCEDMFFSVTTCQMALTVLARLALATKGMIVAVGLPILYRDGLYNTACLLVDGKISGFVCKQHLASTGIHYEPRWFKAWPAGMVGEVMVGEETYPIGDLIFDFHHFRLGFEICEDAWAVVRTGVSLARRGVDIILNPSASHFAFGKSEIRKRFVQEGARAFNVAYIYANLLGNEAGRVVFDGDTIIAIEAQLLANGPRFSFKDRVLTTAKIDLHSLRMQRTNSIEYADSASLTKGIIQLPFPKKIIENECLDAPSQNTGEEYGKTLTKEEEFAQVVALGLFDYLRKSRSMGFVLNLSGGADSSTCVCLVYLMVQLAVRELGIQGFQKKLSYLFKDPITKKDPEHFSKWVLEQILTCLYQKTENSSTVTLKSAQDLCKALGIPLGEFKVDAIIEQYTQLITPVVGRALTWTEDDIALQNVQARVRSPSAWLLANIRNAILLCASNRSEAAVGYATMDGDTSGGLSPIAGVDKSFILHWLKSFEHHAIAGIGPLPILKCVTDQIPTAELRPIGTAQTDEMDLMPYEWLDKIARLFVHDKHSPIEILTMMRKQYPKESIETLATCIERFFKLWSRNQWKRERLAPSFHLDDESVDPKTWCRFPILSGGFEQELAAMWHCVKNPSLSNPGP